MNKTILFPILIIFSLVCFFGNSQGHEFEWATVNGNGAQPYGFAVDSEGNTYNSGIFTNGILFEIDGEQTVFQTNGFNDSYLTKMNTNGEILWAIHLANNSHVSAADCVVDNDGNVYVFGGFNSDVYLGSGPDPILSNEEGKGAFAIKFDANGNLIWSKSFDSSSAHVNSAKLDGQNNLVMTGFYWEYIDADPSEDEYFVETPLGFHRNALIIKLDLDGNLIWATSFGAQGEEFQGTSIDTDSQSNIVITGFFEGTKDFDPGPDVSEISSNGDVDAFVAKITADNEFLWVTSLGGVGEDKIWDVKFDLEDNVYITGRYEDSLLYQNSNGLQQLISNSLQDGFLAKINESGIVDWIHTIGGNSSIGESGQDLLILPDNTVINTGKVSGEVDLDPGINIDLIQADLGDVYMTNFDEDGNYKWGERFVCTYIIHQPSIVIDELENLYVNFGFKDVIDANPGEQTEIINSFGFSSVVVKLSAISTSISENNHSISTIVYPNPMSESSTINFDNPKAQMHQITVYDKAGKVVLEQSTIGNNFSFSKNNLTIGVYLFSLTDTDGVSSSGKILVE